MLFVFCLKLAKDPELIPERLRPFFFGARLTPIRKKDGGVRPIAIGTIFHKLVSSAIMSHLKEELMVFFPPVQFGVAIPGGAENVVHGVRNCLFNDPRKYSSLPRPQERLQLRQPGRLHTGRPGEVPQRPLLDLPILRATIQAHHARMRAH